VPSTILIVDDSRTMRSMVRGALEADHHQVIEAIDGVTALATLETESADMVITDVNMPEMDGLKLVRALRERPRYRFTPILVLTTEGGAEMKQRGREAGATGWLVKPFNPDQLRQTVLHVFRSRPA
jgi:two-component system, chemotaxis family, chemotaxis protein CheY